MSNIFVHLHTWAAGGPYLQSLLTNNQKALASRDFVYSNTTFEPGALARNHEKFFAQLLYRKKNNMALRAPAQQILADWRSCLDAGKHIILSYRPRLIAEHSLDLHAFLNGAFPGHPIKYFINLGRMDYAYEELKQVYPALDESALLASLNEYVAYPDIINKIREAAQPKNVFVLLPQLQPRRNNRTKLEKLANDFCNFMNLPLPALKLPAVVPDLAGSLPMQLVVSANNSWRCPQIDEVIAEFENCSSRNKTLSDLEKERLRTLAEKQKQSWQIAVKIADQGHNWEECEEDSRPDPVDGNLTEIAPITTNFIKTNINLLTDKLRPVADCFLRENNIISPDFPVMSVLTMACNQEKYIAECIESVAAQQCSFSLEHIIVDDCSSDATREIITELARKYPHIKPVFIEQRDNNANIRALFNACRSKYAALCDGDDYFIDPLKLQKQFDFLEAHPDCAICFHPVEKRYEDGSPTELYPPASMLAGKRHIFTLSDLFKGNMMQTNSVVYRWRFGDGLPNWFDASLIPSDWYWHLLHAETGLIGYLPEAMAVYRRHTHSLFAVSERSHTKHRTIFGKRELKLYDALNRHFQGRFQKDLQILANGVLADYLQIYIETDQDYLFNYAVAKYPEFAKNFLAQLDTAKKK